MSEKYLPIKIFEKRKDYDDRSTEGGGDNREPGFVLHGEALSSHVAVLTDELHEVCSALREELVKQMQKILMVHPKKKLPRKKSSL